MSALKLIFRFILLSPLFILVSLISLTFCHSEFFLVLICLCILCHFIYVLLWGPKIRNKELVARILVMFPTDCAPCYQREEKVSKLLIHLPLKIVCDKQRQQYTVCPSMEPWGIWEQEENWNDKRRNFLNKPCKLPVHLKPPTVPWVTTVGRCYARN